MIFDSRGLRVFVFSEMIDMRAGFERLSYYVREKLKGRIDQGHLYLFFGRNRRRLKAIYFDGSGMVLVSKRIERGSFMSLRELEETKEITLSDLKLIFHGSTIRRPKLERSVCSENTFLPHGKQVEFNHASH
jgi:transposase